MQEELVAASCADLLSHAVEAYWNVNATELTDIFALQAIKTFMGSYRRTFESPADPAARGRIVLAGIYAGLAFSNTRTTACHSISYPMTAVFGVPHGIACALTLGEMLEFNSAANREKILALCRIMDCSDAREAKRKIGSILNDLCVKTRLRDYGLDRSDLALILDRAFTPERMVNNPGKVTRQDLEKILERIY
jgi:alcohol dehydrogenase class IV